MSEETIKAIKEMEEGITETMQNLKQEEIEITDSSTGIKVSMSSRELGIKDLTELAQSSFTFAKNQRNGSKKPRPGYD